MNIVVIGIGGVGGYFGGKLTKLLSQRDGLNIYFIARNKHLDAIREHGLILNTAAEGEMVCTPTLATDNFDELPELDLCLICTKSFDLNRVLTSLKTKITDNTRIIPLLNGVDIYERIRSIIPNGIVYPSCVYVGTHIESPGKVVQNGGSCTIMLGSDPQHPDVIPSDIFQMFDDCNIKYKLLDDPYQEIWGKYIFIAAYGMVCASEDKTLGEVLDSDDLRDRVRGIMSEIVEIARKGGTVLAPTIVEESLQKGRNFPHGAKTSFQRDFEQVDKPDERDIFGDTIIRLAEKYGIDTPITRSVNTRINMKKRISL